MFVWDTGSFPVTHKQLLIIQTMRAVLDTKLLTSPIWTQDEVISMSLAELFARDGGAGWMPALTVLLNKLKRMRW